MEKACDEEVIRSMGKGKRKEYAYALLRIVAENGSRKKKYSLHVLMKEI